MILWLVVLIAALWLQSTFAKSSVPSFVDGAWVMPASNVPTVSDGVWTMPARPVHSTMMQYSGYGGYEQAIYDACSRYGCDGATLVRVAGCESGFNPSAVGPHGEIGLFQFMDYTFYAYGGSDIWNPYEQIEVAAQMWSQGLGFHWVCQ
jgi:hypothetical protein